MRSGSRHFVSAQVGAQVGAHEGEEEAGTASAQVRWNLRSDDETPVPAPSGRGRCCTSDRLQ